MNSFVEIFIEALVVGIVILGIGSLVSFIAGLMFKSNLPKICKDWNKNHVMEFALFLTGFFAHLLFEAVGLNAYYVNSKK